MSKCEICGSDLPKPDASGYQREHIVERCRDTLSAALAESRAECERLRERLGEVDRLLEIVGFCNEGDGCVSVPACDLRTAMGKNPIARLDAVRGRVGK